MYDNLVFDFVFIYSFLSTVLVTPQTKPMLVQTTPNMLQNCNQKTTFTQDFDCNILSLQIFQRKDLLCCESFSATRCSLLSVDPPSPNVKSDGGENFSLFGRKTFPGQKERDTLLNSLLPICNLTTWEKYTLGKRFY